MPEGPSVRVFHGRSRRLLGAVVQRAGGRTRQLDVRQLEGRQLQQSQVHGKCLFLGFGRGPRSGFTTDPESVSPTGSSVPVSAGGSGISGNPTPNLWLRFHFGLFGSVRCDEFARAKRANKRGDWQDPSPRLVLYFPGDRFLVFYNCRLCVCGDPRLDPHTDVLSREFDKAKALCALQHAQPVCYTLLCQHHFSGLGNIIKNEVLYLSGIHPMSLGSQLSAEKLCTLLEHVLLFSREWLDNKQKGIGLKYHIYQKDQCPRGHAVKRAELGPPHGLQRSTWWCPVCQPAEHDAPSRTLD
ncbi:endonuclease 8-like 2 [Mobula hypostoma]|uniref:endonuclease 8-like 2 n=1 Tax=Mobula hypostoma TaxID=723540 RepID=UPI002FC379C1